MKKLFLFSMLLTITLPINAGVRCSDFNTQEEAQRYYENHHAYHWIEIAMVKPVNACLAVVNTAHRVVRNINDTLKR